jgi:hypothetical protein
MQMIGGPALQFPCAAARRRLVKCRKTPFSRRTEKALKKRPGLLPFFTEQAGFFT